MEEGRKRGGWWMVDRGKWGSGVVVVYMVFLFVKAKWEMSGFCLSTAVVVFCEVDIEIVMKSLDDGVLLSLRNGLSMSLSTSPCCD